jgi:hypothetical protein
MLFSYYFLNLNYIRNTQITQSKIFYTALKKLLHWQQNESTLKWKEWKAYKTKLWSQNEAQLHNTSDAVQIEFYVSKSCIQYENKKTANTFLYCNSHLCKYSGHIILKALNDSPHCDMLLMEHVNLQLKTRKYLNKFTINYVRRSRILNSLICFWSRNFWHTKIPQFHCI